MSPLNNDKFIERIKVLIIFSLKKLERVLMYFINDSLKGKKRQNYYVQSEHSLNGH